MERDLLLTHDLASFLRRFHTEEDCVSALAARQRAPACARCAKRMRLRVQRRAWVCRCGVSRAVTQGTPFYRLKVPLTVAFHALGRMLLRPKSIAALDLVREKRVRRYETAWNLLMRLRVAIGMRLHEMLDDKLIAGAACTHICGRHRRRVPQGFVGFAVDPAARVAWVTSAPKRLRHATRPFDPDARLIAESFRAVVVGTHHGVSARHLTAYAVEHAARFIHMPIEAVLAVRGRGPRRASF